MTDDQFAVIGHDENGHPKIRYCLDPREVTIIRDPERDGEVIGYIWEPVGPVPSPIQSAGGIDVHSIDMEERRGPRRRRWWRWSR